MPDFDSGGGGSIPFLPTEAGKASQWAMAAVLKTDEGQTLPWGFDSLPSRQIIIADE